MNHEGIRRALRYGSAALILAGVMGLSSLANADDKKNTASKPAPKPPTPAATHSTSTAATHTAAGGGTHTTTSTSTASHGATSTTTGSHGTTTTTAGSHGATTTTTGAGGHNTTTTTTTTGGHGGSTTAAGGHPTGGGNATAMGAHPVGGAHPSAFHNPPARGVNEHVTHSGSAIRTRPNGRISDVHDARRGMDVHHGLGGGRRVSVERADHSRIVAEHGRRGFVERPYNYHGHDFARRSYYYHGHAYERYYHGYGYRGVMLNVYAPAYYYRPGFYGWAYNPWAAPVAFGWGWGGTPWYGRYGYYFQPYPVYPSAAFWLTDYIISQDLQAAYAAHQEAAEADGGGAPAGGQPVMTPEVKQMIADEVRNQLALENQEAQQNTQGQDVDPGSSGIARLLSDGRPHVFVAGGNLDVQDDSGTECVVSDGDALELRQPPPSDATAAKLVVLSSKGRPECQISLTVQVTLADLQEMQNHMRETIDQGLQELQSKQGKDGLPAAPPSAQGQPAQAQYAAVAPPPEPDLGNQIQQQDQQAAQVEKEVSTEAQQDGGSAAVPVAEPAASPASVELGQTTDQVQAAMGAPKRVANLGAKQIYYYDGLKVTFKDGKVSDVQ